MYGFEDSPPRQKPLVSLGLWTPSDDVDFQRPSDISGNYLDAFVWGRPLSLLGRFLSLSFFWFSGLLGGHPLHNSRSKNQGAAQFLPNGCSRKMPLSFRSFEWGRLLEHSFLEHFCLDQFSVILGKFYMQDSRTPRLLEHFWVPILGASCSNKLFVGTVRPSQRST